MSVRERTMDCERCSETIEYTGNLAKCGECGWYEWWPDGEPTPESHPGW